MRLSRRRSLPLGARFPRKCLADQFLHLGPCGGVKLKRKAGIGEPQRVHELRVELRFNAAHRHVLAVQCLIRVVKRCSTVERVRASLAVPHSVGVHAVQKGGEQRRSVNHRRIDNLTPARFSALEQSRDDAKGQHQPTAGEVGQQVLRCMRSLTCPADWLERAGDGDVVDVVSSPRR
jgi:hypothetical protein